MKDSRYPPRGGGSGAAKSMIWQFYRKTNPPIAASITDFVSSLSPDTANPINAPLVPPNARAKSAFRSTFSDARPVPACRYGMVTPLP